MVTFNHKSRNYTNCTCLSTNNITWRNNIMNAYRSEILKLRDLEYNQDLD